LASSLRTCYSSINHRCQFSRGTLLHEA
jgi:hypothetical protein